MNDNKNWKTLRLNNKKRKKKNKITIFMVYLLENQKWIIRRIS